MGTCDTTERVSQIIPRPSFSLPLLWFRCVRSRPRLGTDSPEKVSSLTNTSWGPSIGFSSFVLTPGGSPVPTSRPCLLHADCRWRDRLISLLLAYWLMALRTATHVCKNTKHVLASVHRQQRASCAQVWGMFSPQISKIEASETFPT